METSTIWQQLQRVQAVIKQGSPEIQDVAIAALQDTLATGQPSLFPSFVYPLLTDVLRFYCRNVLPKLSLSIEDQRMVREAFERTITHLNTQESTAKQLEVQLKQFFTQVKSGTFESVEKVVIALKNLTPNPFPERRGEQRRLGNELSIVKEFDKSYRLLQKSPFTARHVIPFFDALLHDALPDDIREAFAFIHDIFWHQLRELLDIKAMLVNPKTREALITRFDITTSLKANGLDEVIIQNMVDDRLDRSCWNAVQAARALLEEHFPDALNNRSLHVSGRFPNPIAEYTDTSASLLVSLKVIGDVLDLEIDPHTVVSGEIDESGNVRPVTCLAEKVLAAQQHPEIHRILLPAEGMFMTSRRIDVIGVRDLSEAVFHYYGEPFRKKLKQVSRRKMLQGALALAVAPLTPVVFSAFRNILTHPVSEHDVQLLECAGELYQKKSDYRSATIILQSILDRFSRETSSPEVVRLKAYALGALGIIYLQQHRIAESLTAFHKAATCWESLHDRQNQADILIRIGSVYRHTVAMDGMTQNSRLGLRYYHQANALLRPAMPQFTKLRGRADSMIGHLYYWMKAYALAGQYGRQGVALFEEPDTNWTYQICQQHLGRTLIHTGQYDDAHDILQSTANAAVLQGPHDRARSLLALSELFFAIENQEEGRQYAEHARELCQTYGIRGQQQILTKILRNYKNRM